MNSGIADVVPFVASEKNVDACVVSSLWDQVYDDWIEKPPCQRRRASKMNARYHESPSLVLNSIVVNAGFGRGVFGGMKRVPSGNVTGCARFRSELRSRCVPREPAYATITTVSANTSRSRLAFQTCTRGLSRSH